MGFLDKLAFWRKEESPDMNTDFGASIGQDNLGGMDSFGAPDFNQYGQDPMAGPQFGNNALPANSFNSYGNDFGGATQFGIQQPTPSMRPRFQQPQMAPPGFQPQSMQTAVQGADAVARDIELLSYKLDTIKAALDMVNQRLANLERLAMPDRERRW